MKLYLDNCCFNRPYDDQDYIKIRLETEAKLDIQRNIRKGIISLCWSYVLEFENKKNPFDERRLEIKKWKELAIEFAYENEAILKDMDGLVNKGIKPLDALHIACAIDMDCSFFLTVDKGILKKADQISKIQIMNPVDFILKGEDE